MGLHSYYQGIFLIQVLHKQVKKGRNAAFFNLSNSLVAPAFNV